MFFISFFVSYHYDKIINRKLVNMGFRKTRAIFAIIAIILGSGMIWFGLSDDHIRVWIAGAIIAGISVLVLIGMMIKK